jgi:hypothetical protein
MKPKKESLYIGNERIKRSIIFFIFYLKKVKRLQETDQSKEEPQ